MVNKQNNSLKIAICTKGRYGYVTNRKGEKVYRAINLGKIYKHALENDLSELDNVFMFVEPQEASDYKDTYPKWPIENIIVLGDNNQGLGYTRQTALQFFQDTIPSETICMLDDDAILMEYKWGIHPKKGEKFIAQEVPLVEGLNHCYEYMKNLPEYDKVGIQSLEYCQFSWSKETSFPLDQSFMTDKFSNIGSNHSYCDCIVFWKPLLAKELGITYDNLPLKCDRDFAFQFAYHGYYTRKIYRFIMDSPLNGTAAGGCQDWYKKENQEATECEKLVEKWSNSFNTSQELVSLKPKKTCYGRSADIKFWWKRMYVASYNSDKISSVTNLYEFPKSINDYSNYLIWSSKDAE